MYKKKKKKDNFLLFTISLRSTEIICKFRNELKVNKTIVIFYIWSICTVYILAGKSGRILSIFNYVPKKNFLKKIGRCGAVLVDECACVCVCGSLVTEEVS